jgi:ceramide glucosyltransferase
MIHPIARVIELIAVLGTASSIAYYILCLWGAAAFARERRAAAADRAVSESRGRFVPPVSILKPLKGSDPEIYESFRSHCLQDYPEYEIIFGVSDPADPAIASVRQVQREFPDRPIQLVICSNTLGANTKVSNLAQMLGAARFDYLIINDSDIRVEADYLRRIVAPLSDAKVGMVTCLYRGVAGATLGSRLESLGISTDFCAGVLAARQIESGIRFGLGSTLAFRRAELARIGGFESFVDYLADDYELGRRIAALGLQIKLSDVVVETFLPAYSLRGFFEHQLRWGRGVRDARAGGYWGLAFTFGLMWSVLAVAAAQGAAWAWALFAVTVLWRLTLAVVVGKIVLKDQQVLRSLWLIPLRDFAAILVWMASLAGHTVTWRGERFYLKQGKLRRISG